MSEWKLTRHIYGTEEYKFKEGDEVTIGRMVSNTIALTSIVISRKHCVINFFPNKTVVTDTGSSNGVYVGKKRIPQNSPYEVEDCDIIGIGWTLGATIVDNLKDDEKYMFKLTKVSNGIRDRFLFQNEEVDEIEKTVAALDAGPISPPKSPSPILSSKLSLKRKSDVGCDEIKKEIKVEKKRCRIVTVDEDIISLLSDSDHESLALNAELIDNVKLEPIIEESNKNSSSDHIKSENEFLEFEAFNVKQEYMGYDDEAIKVESDSDSESEHWYLRLSQNSPGKPFCKVPKTKNDEKAEDSSYSQMDDNFIDLSSDNDEEFMDDIISIPPPSGKTVEPHISDQNIEQANNMSDMEEFTNDIITLQEPISSKSPKQQITSQDEVDSFKQPVTNQSILKNAEPTKPASVNDIKKAQMIEPQFQPLKGKSKHTSHESKSSSSRSSKHGKDKKHSSKKHISESQKEERKKKLKEIATKDKESDNQSINTSTSSVSKTISNVKITGSNRGAFLTSAQEVKPISKKDEPKATSKKKKSIQGPPDNSKNRDSVSPPDKGQNRGSVSSEDRENTKKQSSKSHSSKKHEHKHSKSKRLSKHDGPKSKSENKSHESSKNQESRVPLKSLKPLTESDKTNSGKPFSKVDPLPGSKPKKKVRFSDAGPDVHLFEIEPGNHMKKINTSIKSVDVRKMPIFSLEKITLMKILRWNPSWLEEQLNNNDPPPILGHSNPPMSIFHSFTNHHQYVQLVGDLLLMEIWECLSLAYMKIRGQNFALQMQIGSLPPMPTQERSSYELFSFSVNVSLPSHDTKMLPRVGEILLISFGPESAQTRRFFYVNNVRCLPSPPNNIHSFYIIGLHATYTEKMRTMRLGEVMLSRSLTYIGKELNLFEAMEYLASSPLSEAILRPEPRHFEIRAAPPNSMALKWTQTLNPSQRTAVSASVAAALGDKPSIQMVQGPPGTGKSSVICAIVMSYLYNEQGQRQQNRAKIMICATSNAAVDELVIRLLNIRQSLPKSERFRMVRVGREEAMAARAHDVSSQQLAQRDAARLNTEPTPRHANGEEIAHLEAKLNMWKTAAQDAKDPVRVAYCEGRVNDLVKRLTLVRAGGGVGKELRPDQLIAAERRIIEGADVVVTTLSSAYNNKMRGLKRRIALCIIDEAGQAIEPETLIPLTLDVTRLTLIGDPQQLPGYICSQRAKKHGLGESLFSRLTSNSEHWAVNPVSLLNQQYRMHADIADYPNRAFYGGVVRTVGLERPLLPIPPYSILSISSGDKGQGACGGNEMEAWGVSRLVVALAAVVRSRSLSLAVITPYNAHKELIKKNLKMLQAPSEAPIEVNTVDSFQGQERDVMVVSLARSHGVGFLTDAGRMNVMLTRARHALVICLNPHAMLKNPQWRTLIEDAQIRKMYKILPNNMCQPTSLAKNAQSDILKYLASPK